MNANEPSSTGGEIVGTKRQPSAPIISVVVASNRERTLLDACLASLIPQCGRTGAELIVARAGSPAELSILRQAYPGVRYVGAPATAGIPHLRGLGMSEATGDIVALTEDHCVADQLWLETILGHATENVDVIGGGMDNARRDRAIDWGAYFAEYGFFAPTRPEQTTDAPLLTGANVAYKRHVIRDVVALAQQGEWENVAHHRLLERGRVLRFIRTAAIYQNKSYSFWPFVIDRYQHGRDYARKRLSEDPHADRWKLLLGSPLLPLVLTWRVARATGGTRPFTFLRALPATLAFLTAWSVGEAVGYLRGSSRDGVGR